MIGVFAAKQLRAKKSQNDRPRRCRGRCRDGGSTRKIDNFLPNRLVSGIVFQKSADKPGSDFWWATCDWGFRVTGREWLGNGGVTSTLVRQAAAGAPIAGLDAVRGGLQDGSKELARKAGSARVTKKDAQPSESIGARPFVRDYPLDASYQMIHSDGIGDCRRGNHSQA